MSQNVMKMIADDSVGRSSRPEVFLGKDVAICNYAINLQENTHTKV